ncbi:hypothetical protein [Halorhabdus amylolytica]|uniref:hypothetical protein n=1 Tax=Halorhabdus amylolytica TaxID=2559573 RepID=UPI0010AA45CB|nr:hypothetical protein [Halorhabdus amylolytica]
MTLSDERQIIRVWDAFADSDFQYASDSGDIYELGEMNQEREDRLPVRREMLQDFLDGKTDLTTFKQEMDSECSSHKLWGFSGFSGQMFFNMLVSSVDTEGKSDLAVLLRKVLPAPESEEKAADRIQQLKVHVEEVKSGVEDARKAPNSGFIPYFLSYFWQLQEPDTYPIYYKSIRRALSDLAIWDPSDDIAEGYLYFWRLNEEIRDVLENHADREINLWTIERMFLFWLNRDEIARSGENTGDNSTPNEKQIGTTERQSLPDSYIPPIVSVLPDLARNSDEMQDIVSETGQAVETLFEDRLAKCLQMLGYTVEERGQGSGRNPDGIAKARRYNYAIIYDAKARQKGYRFSTGDERQFRDYIDTEVGHLQDQGFRNVYFAVFSSSFDADRPDPVRRLKIETDIQEVRLVVAEALLELLETRLREPDFTLGPSGAEGPGVQDFFAESGTLTAAEVQEQIGR